ncbi:MAG: shikimate kinase [Eubacterium sp.]|nr:shikimate kinase [Eubacterium sp.]
MHTNKTNAGRDNITLIGMPGAGKSTVGVVLAKVLGYRFLDSDLQIQEQTKKRLYELIGEYGDEGFLKIENEVNAGICACRTVIATGGSAVYGRQAMEHLRDISTVIYLKLSCKALEERLGDLQERGVVMGSGSTLSELMDERCPLYEKYAHLTVDAERMDIRGIVDAILLQLHG